MKYLNQDEINDILVKNEKENVYYHIVLAHYMYDIEDVLTGKLDKKVAIQQAIQFGVDNKSFFIINDMYKDSSPSHLVISERQLLDENYTILSIKIHSHQLEEARINKVLAEKLGGKFSDKPNAQALFNKIESFEKEIIEFAKDLKQDKLGDYYVRASQKNTEYCKEISESFDKELDKKINALTSRYEVELKEREKLANERKEKENLERQEKAKLKDAVALKTVKSEVLDSLGYYPKLTVNEKDNTQLTLNIYNGKDEVIDTLPLKIEVKDVVVGYDSYGDSIYQYYAHINEESTSLISDKQYNDYFKVLYFLENSMIMEDAFTYLNSRKIGNEIPRNNQFWLVLNNENELMHSLNYEYKKENTLKEVNKAHEAFKDSIEPEVKSTHKQRVRP